jgi:Uma2 family endonuclease
MKFYEGAPVFAVEVRSESDYGLEAELAMAQKRADYFAAGTQVVWDVDLLSDAVIKSYSAKEPNKPFRFHKGELAHAEPVLLGWRFVVDNLFPNDLE